MHAWGQSPIQFWSCIIRFLGFLLAFIQSVQDAVTHSPFGLGQFDPPHLLFEAQAKRLWLLGMVPTLETTSPVTMTFMNGWGTDGLIGLEGLDSDPFEMDIACV